MKRPLVRIVVPVLAVGILVAGCSSGGSDSSSASPSTSTADQTPTAADIAAIDSVKVTGDAGADPTVKFTAPLSVSATTTKVTSEGTGADIEDGQVMLTNLAAYSGKDASKVDDTWASGVMQPLTLSADYLQPSIYDALKGQKVGTRFVIGIPPNSSSSDTQVLVGEVAQAFDARAKGEKVTPADGLPTVTLADSGEPSIKIPDGYTAPQDLVVQPLIKGSGPEVKAEDHVTVQYTGWTLDGKSFDSSWASGSPAYFSLGSVIKGWGQGLTGQTVGSQVMLIIPPSLAYGEATASPSASPATGADALKGQTLVFVIDILQAG